MFLQNVLWWRHFLWQARHIITATWNQGGAASTSHPAPVGTSTPMGLGGSWGKNTWFRLCWSTLDRRSSTTLTLLPSSYTTTSTTTTVYVTTVPVIILKELISREFKSLIRGNGYFGEEFCCNYYRVDIITRARVPTSQTSEYQPGWSGSVRFNLN